MTFERFPVGVEVAISDPYHPMSLTLLSTTAMRLERKGGPTPGAETVDIHVLPLRKGLFALSWREQSGATVTQVQDFERGLVHSHTLLPDGEVLRTSGSFVVREARRVLDL